MRTRRTLLTFLAMVGLGTATWYVEIYRPQKRVRQEETKTLLTADWPWEKLKTLRLKNPSTEIEFARLQQKDENNEFQYAITYPFAAVPDTFAVRNVISALTAIKIQRPIAERGDKLSAFGLEPAAMTLTATFAGADGQSQRHTLLLGEANSGKDGTYAKRAEAPAVFLVGTDLDSQKDRSLFDFREKRLFALKSEKIHELEIVKGKAQAIALRKEKEAWRITSPQAAAADSQRISQLLNSLAALRALSFPSERADSEAERYGLNAPSLRLVIGQEGKKERQTLLLGKLQEKGTAGGSATEKHLYARLLGQPTVYEVGAEQLTDLGLDFSQAVSKELLAVDSSRLSALRLTSSGTHLELTKDEATKLWHLTAPAKDLADARQVEDFLDQLERLRGDAFLGFTHSLPKEGAAMTLILTHHTPASPTIKESKEASLLQIFQGGPKGALLAKSAKSGFFYSFAQNNWQNLLDQANRLRDRRLIRLDPALVEKLAVTQDGQTVEVKPQSDLGLELLKLECSRFEDQADEAWKKSKGLTQAKLSIALTPQNAKGKKVLLPFGLEENGGRWALNEKGTPVLANTAALAQLLAKLFPEKK